MVLAVAHKTKKTQFADERRKLMGTTAMYQGESLIQEGALLTSHVNDNRYGVVAKATNSFEKRIMNRQEEANDYANALVVSEEERDLDADSASASRNHFLSAIEEIRDNKDLDSPEAIKLFLNEVRVRNAAEVLLAGKAFGYALDSIDYVMDFLAEVGKGDIQKGIEELQSGKVGEERLEDRASVVSEKVTLGRQQADELAKSINRSNIRNLPAAQAKQEYERMMSDRLIQPDHVNRVVDQLDKEVVEKAIEQRDKNDAQMNTFIYDKDSKSFTKDAFIAVAAGEMLNPTDKSKDKDKEERAKEMQRNAAYDAERETDGSPSLIAMTFDNKTGGLVPTPGKPKRT